MKNQKVVLSGFLTGFEEKKGKKKDGSGDYHMYIIRGLVKTSGTVGLQAFESKIYDVKERVINDLHSIEHDVKQGPIPVDFEIEPEIRVLDLQLKISRVQSQIDMLDMTKKKAAT